MYRAVAGCEFAALPEGEGPLRAEYDIRLYNMIYYNIV